MEGKSIKQNQQIVTCAVKDTAATDRNEYNKCCRNEFVKGILYAIKHKHVNIKSVADCALADLGTQCF